jgi:hypothetical protein
MTGTLTTKKYIRQLMRFNIRKIATNLYTVTVFFGGQQADNVSFSSGQTILTSTNLAIVTADDIVNMTVRNGYTATVKNGTRLVVIGR